MGTGTYKSPTFTHVLRIAFIAFLFTLVALYALFQSRNLLSGPGLLLTQEPSTVQSERLVTLAGIATNITLLTLNGKPIFTDETGAFSNTLVLENGYTIMTLYAEDRFGRRTSLTKTFVYRPNIN